LSRLERRWAGSATAAQVPRGLSFQVPYAERVRKEAGIATMALGIEGFATPTGVVKRHT
jgi:hypothetical protein